MGLPFLFLVQRLFRVIVSKCWGTKTEKVPNSNHMLQICLTFVIHFFLIFDARPSSEFLSTRSIRGSIMAICTVPFYHLFLEHNLKYSLSDKSSNILVISMYSFFLSIMLIKGLVKEMDKQCWANSAWPEAHLIFKLTPNSVVWRAIEVLNQ